MKVGWLHDGGNADGTMGGAELTQAEFRAAAPEGVEIIDCAPAEVEPDLDVYVAHNIVYYSLADLAPTKGRLVKYWHDVGPHMSDDVLEQLADERQVCCSPLQRGYLGLDEAQLIPPALDLDRFQSAGQQNGRPRRGIVALGPWMNYGKTPRPVLEWAEDRQVDFFGTGPLAPPGAREVDYDDMPELLAHYETYVHLPLVIEPFGRGVVEAWAAGCKIITNNLVGARYWIEKNPKRLETASEDFWKLVLK